MVSETDKKLDFPVSYLKPCKILSSKSKKKGIARFINLLFLAKSEPRVSLFGILTVMQTTNGCPIKTRSIFSFFTSTWDTCILQKPPQPIRFPHTVSSDIWVLSPTLGAYCARERKNDKCSHSTIDVHRRIKRTPLTTRHIYTVEREGMPAQHGPIYIH